MAFSYLAFKVHPSWCSLYQHLIPFMVGNQSIVWLHHLFIICPSVCVFGLFPSSVEFSLCFVVFDEHISWLYSQGWNFLKNCMLFPTVAGLLAFSRTVSSSGHPRRYEWVPQWPPFEISKSKSCVLVCSFLFQCFALFQQYGLRSPWGPSPSSYTFYEIEGTVKGSFFNYLPGFTSGTISLQASLVGFLIISSVSFFSWDWFV